MMKGHTTKILTAIALVATLAVASYAFADWGRGWTGHMGYGPHHRGMMGHDQRYGPEGGECGRGYGPGRGGPRSEMSEEQIEKMETQREAFFKDTEPIRQKLYEKEMALKSELAKENPDIDAAKALQSEISGLRAEFDQKRLEHRVKMRKIVPEAGRGYKDRGGRGPRGGGYGYGYNPGACWR
jgi:zinc resistance-associated protein